MGVSATVTKSNLFSQAYINLFNLINDRSNIPDPLGTTQREMVYKKVPSVKGRGFENYPIIILSPANVTTSEKTLDNKHAKNTTEFKVEIISSNRMPGQHNGKGAEYLDSLSDSLMALMNNESKLKILRVYFMNNAEISVDDTDTITDEGISVFVRRFTLTFNTRMAVSS